MLRQIECFQKAFPNIKDSMNETSYEWLFENVSKSGATKYSNNA
jgi:hypothetical protein